MVLQFNLSFYDSESVKELVEPWTNDHADLSRSLNIEVAIDASRIASTQVFFPIPESVDNMSFCRIFSIRVAQC